MGIKPLALHKIRADSSSSSQEILSYMARSDVQTFIQKVCQDYIHFDELRHKTLPAGVKFESLWSLIRMFRDGQSRRIGLPQIPGFTFTYFLTDDVLHKLHLFDIALGGNIEALSGIPPDDKEFYIVSSLMEEGIASSILEGAAVTREQAKQMLREDRRPQNDSERMIRNNYAAIKEIINLKGMHLTPDLLCSIQAMITEGTLDDPAKRGVFRTTNDVRVEDSLTGEPVYFPPDVAHLPLLLNYFCDFANDKTDDGFIHPIVKAAILHFLMAYIHPFRDGNGRTARAVFYWYLLSKGYRILEYLSISRQILKTKGQYYRAFIYAESDENDLTYFLNYHIMVLDRALSDLQKYVRVKLDEKRGMYDLLQSKGLNERQLRILADFAKTSERMFKIYEVEQMFGVVYQTARNDLFDLERKGLLERRVIGKRRLVFVRSKAFDENLSKIRSS